MPFKKPADVNHQGDEPHVPKILGQQKKNEKNEIYSLTQ